MLFPVTLITLPLCVLHQSEFIPLSSTQQFPYFLNHPSINHSREYLHLPEEVIPATLKRQTRQDTGRGPMMGRQEGDIRKPIDQDRAAYRGGMVFISEKSRFAGDSCREMGIELYIKEERV